MTRATIPSLKAEVESLRAQVEQLKETNRKQVGLIRSIDVHYLSAAQNLLVIAKSMATARMDFVSFLKQAAEADAPDKATESLSSVSSIQEPPTRGGTG